MHIIRLTHYYLIPAHNFLHLPAILSSSIHNIMGACCQKLFGRDSNPLKEESNRTELISKEGPLSVQRHTANDHHFTYFLDVFELSDCGKVLKRPEFANSTDPHFSPQQFQDYHRDYHRLVQ